MIELFAADTPNGKKISIMLEEVGYEYKVTKVDLSNDDHYNPEIRKISHFVNKFFIPICCEIINLFSSSSHFI